jgi:hypothetical protein
VPSSVDPAASLTGDALVLAATGSAAFVAAARDAGLALARVAHLDGPALLALVLARLDDDASATTCDGERDTEGDAEGDTEAAKRRGGELRLHPSRISAEEARVKAGTRS